MLDRQKLCELNFPAPVEAMSPLIGQLLGFIYSMGRSELSNLGLSSSDLVGNLNGLISRIKNVYLKMKRGIEVNCEVETDEIISSTIKLIHTFLDKRKPDDIIISYKQIEKKDDETHPVLSCLNVEVFIKVSNSNMKHELYFKNYFMPIFSLIFNFIKPTPVKKPLYQPKFFEPGVESKDTPSKSPDLTQRI